MKKYKIALHDGKTALVKATSHKLTLKNGEKVDVIVHRPYDLEEKYWCVTDRETGYQIVGTDEYYCMMCPEYFRGVDTKERALWTAVAKLNFYICDNGKTFAEIKAKRIEKLNKTIKEKYGADTDVGSKN